ncbi:Myocyte-specific enhancer factor 2A [Schistosoma japonicum]|uniref:Myocyte-specific enhancer factor 2A n=1 Tax=Schistosoma japonicum TaxID=6182 RepID=A0A4Z2CRE8_SCHJA|nr:Myocyte-specific enhancer factor 2A [Schistosoma japonicum]
MGRKKIEIKFIKDEKNRLVTFAKRKSGLFKKAYELSVLCECEIALLVFTRSNRLYQYASVTVDHALQRLKKHHRANEFLSNSDMERLTNRRMRSDCNESDVIPSQRYSNIKSEQSENGNVDDDDEEEDEDEEEQDSMTKVKKINNSCNIICQPTDNDNKKFDQINMQINARFVVQPQSTYNIHPLRSINPVTETHMGPVSSLSLPPNPLMSSINNTTETEYMPHIQPILVSHVSTSQPLFSSDSQMIHYPSSSLQSSLCSSVAPFTCDNNVVNSKLLFTNLPKPTIQPPEQISNILPSKQSSMPYMLHHSSNNQAILPVDCSNLHDTHLVDNNSYMNTSLTHSFSHTTVANTNISSSFSPTNTLGQLQCTLLSPTPYTQELKVDQPIFILSSVVANNSNHSLLDTNLNSPGKLEQELPRKNALQDLPHLSSKHNYSESSEQHRQIDDYRSGVYVNPVNHFATISAANLVKTTTVTTNASLTTPIPSNKHTIVPQRINSNINSLSESVVIMQKMDAPTQTLHNVIDLDNMPSLSSSSITTTNTTSMSTSLVSRTVTLTASEISHSNHLGSDNINSISNKNVTKNSNNQINMNEKDSQQEEDEEVPPQQRQNQSRLKRIPAMKHLKLPSTCSSTLSRQTSIPNGYFLSTPEVINELGRLDSHRNNSSSDPSDNHSLWHTLSPADIFYRLGLHQVLSLSPAPPASREPPIFSISHSPISNSLASSSSSLSPSTENQNSLPTITQPLPVSQSSYVNMDTVSGYCESESQNSPNVLPKYAKRSKYS